MDRIVDILGAGFGDGKEYYKEQAYGMIRLSNKAKPLTIKQIDKRVKKYLEYGLMRRIKDTQMFKDYYKYQLTDKGTNALDHYRNSSGYKDMSKGVLF